jgi:uncharacterized coiled-coil protein SlyX
MNRKGSASLIILIVLIIISLGLGAGAFYLYQQEHAKNIQLQVQIDELTTRQKITEDKLDEAKKQAAEFQLKVEESKVQITALTNELAQEKSARLEVSNRLDQINSDLSQQKALRQDLEDRLSQSEADGKKIKDQIKIITQEKKDLETKIKNLEAGTSGVELGMVVVNQDKGPAFPVTKEPAKVEKKPEAPLGKPLEGKISVVNKEYNFAVINLGSKNGVKLGDEFTVTRGGKSVGKLKVEKVHEAMSAAGYAAEFKDYIRENDVVQKVQ